MKSLNRKKLSLRTETLRHLSTAETQQVVGGEKTKPPGPIGPHNSKFCPLTPIPSTVCTTSQAC